jgi:hypothetical protein
MGIVSLAPFNNSAIRFLLFDARIDLRADEVTGAPQGGFILMCGVDAITASGKSRRLEFVGFR